MTSKWSQLLSLFAAFVAWGYATHWIPMLRWMGYSFVFGAFTIIILLITLHFLTARSSGKGRDASFPHYRGSVLLSSSGWESDLSNLQHRRHYKPTVLPTDSRGASESLDELLNLVLRDFITSWYSHINEKPHLSNEIDRAIRFALENIRDRLHGVDLVDVLIARLVPILTAHFRDFHMAETAVRGRKLNRSVTESEELDLAIASKFRDGKLHPAASLSFPDTKLIQQDYLRGLAHDILPAILPANLLSSSVVSTLVKEIVVCAVLFPVMQSLSDPDTWNQLMENYGRTMLQDRSTVRKLRAALDQHASPKPKTGRTANFPRLIPGDSERHFEKFIRAIRRANTLSDAKRLRSEISSQLKRDSMQDSQDQVYLRRLEMGKRVLDQKVQQLAVGGDWRASHQPLSASVHAVWTPSSSKLENAPLGDLLRDSSGLSYFMEYMDRQNMLPLVQFWLVVDGFRNPLEEDGQDDEQATTALAMWTDSDRIDIQQLDKAYLSRPELRVPGSVKQDVRDFLAAGQSATPLQYHKARKAIFAAQTAVLEEMKANHFQGFKKSDLFYKCLASQEVLQGPTPSTTMTEIATKDSPQQTSRGAQANARPHPVLKAESRLLIPEAKRSSSMSDLQKPHPGTSGLDGQSGPRKLFDEESFTPLFDDEDDNQSLMDSVPGLDVPQPGPDTQVIEAVEQALNSIMEGDRTQTAEGLRDSLFGIDRNPSMFAGGLPGLIKDVGATNRSFLSSREGDKPSLESLGLVNAGARARVFTDEELFADEYGHIPEEDIDDKPVDTDEDEVHEAAPGDLRLAEAITILTTHIEKLLAQEAIVDSLTRKAELTNNTAELRILRKSKASLQREIRRNELQRQQYAMQESDYSLYGRSSVRIQAIQVGKDDEGREFALYVVEVRRNAGEQMPATTWNVARRYSEFHDLHQRLRSLYPSVRSLDFPRRRVVMKFQNEFLRKRRAALEKYLRDLLLIPEVCRSRELRGFLSQSVTAPHQDLEGSGGKKDMITRLYDSVADGVDDILGNIPALDQISLAGQNLIAAATNQLNTVPVDGGDASTSAAEAEAELNAFDDKERESFITPICDIFLEVFELNRGNNWLRGRAVVVVLQQLLGGTIERRVRENVKALAQEDAVVRYMQLVKGILWPNGQLNRNKPIRGPAERKGTRTEASLLLATLVPDLAGGVVGRLNAQAASRRIFATFNNPRLNLHLAYTLLDEIIRVLFEGSVPPNPCPR